jgi:2-keto-4-pentenoate hydratase/2-oxohepta-3-ene-1,7-dioic acid hydratase in catechol pathway
MSQTRRDFVAAAATAAGAASLNAQGQAVRFVRFRRGSTTAYGTLEGDSISEVRGSIFESYRPTGTRHRLADVKLLYPCEPPKVLAVGLNYKSHLGQRTPPAQPELFYKPVTSLQNPEDSIVIPPGALNVHYEGELVLVIGKKVKNVSEAEAASAIFGVTCGNDVSERDWQKADLQWWRAKGSDTFGPFGPAIVRGLDYSKSLLQTRVNGKVVQRQFISDLLFAPAAIVSYASKFVTLTPGDVIFTGTPGTTQAMKSGDVVEVEIEGVGLLRNKVT